MRFLFRLLALVLVISLVRQIIGMIAKALRQAGSVTRRQGQGDAQAPRSLGELKRDPVCGTFVAPASSIQKTVNGQVVYFCSTGCRDKYLVT